MSRLNYKLRHHAAESKNSSVRKSSGSNACEAVVFNAGSILFLHAISERNFSQVKSKGV